MWVELIAIDLSCNVQQFLDAVQVWINKPHTVNRRLVGSRQTLFEESSCTYNNNRAKALEECIRKDAGGHEKYIRELIPKQLGRFHTAVEAILKSQSENKCRYTFIPLVHTDEHRYVVHEDNTLAYTLSYNHHVHKLSVSVSKHNEEPTCTSLGVSEEWLQDTLIKKLMNWCTKTSLAVETTSLRLLPVDVYTLKYQYLKNKYGQDLVKTWPEKTDPRKFVYEDIAIAAYLIVLWEKEQTSLNIKNKQSFVDLGCGNGLLVYLLTQEGYHGMGIDIRKRQIWDMYGSDTVLLERAFTPSDDNLFPKYDWLIGNHSDELTPWIPVIAARSSLTCKFFVLPCCPWDFTCKFGAKRSGLSVYQNYLNFVHTVIETCGFIPERDTLRIPSTKRVCFVGRTREDNFEAIDANIDRFIESRKILHLKSTGKSESVKQHSTGLDSTRRSACELEQINTSDVTEESHTDMSVETHTVCCDNIGDASLDKDMLEQADTTCTDTEHIQEMSATKRTQALTDYASKRHCSISTQDRSGASNVVAHSSSTEPHYQVSQNADAEPAICSYNSDAKSRTLQFPEQASKSWVSNFKARKFEDELTSHCTKVHDDVKRHIVHTVFSRLLSDITCKDSVLYSTGGKTWRRGGELALPEAVKLFGSETLTQLKTECGGLQTLLKNHHNVFIVQSGKVRLRDWTAFEEFDQFQQAKKKRKGLTDEQIASISAKLWKTQICFNFQNHPDGCPLTAALCRFAHGENELRSKVENSYKT